MSKTKTSRHTDTEHGMTKHKLRAEIRKITARKIPLADKMREIRDLIEQYFRMNGNEEMLNAGL